MQPAAIAAYPIALIGLLMAVGAIATAAIFELVVRRIVPMEMRQSHSAIGSAMFSVVGTTYAVLLAFVAMLAWDGSNHARATTDAEASVVDGVYELLGGLPPSVSAPLRQNLVEYARTVVTVEWPSMAAGERVAPDEANLARLREGLLRLRPGNLADIELRTLLIGDLDRLSNARRERLAAGETAIPPIVWFVLISGGTITIAFGSFLAAPSLRMHIAMSSLLALSGAAVLLVIVTLSTPFRGDFRISPEPFEHVLARMAAPEAPPDQPARP